MDEVELFPKITVTPHDESHYITPFKGCTKSLLDVLSHLGVSKAFIITGKSLEEKTPVIKNLEKVLSLAHAGTYSGVREHAYVEDASSLPPLLVLSCRAERYLRV